jgi:hypothetical protein
MALNTDYAIRTGAFDPVQLSKYVTDIEHLSHNELKEKAEERYQEAKVPRTVITIFIVRHKFLIFKTLLNNLCREQKVRNWFLAQMTLLCVFGNLRSARNVWQE